jgi:outer membrane protein assembly factor BamB
MFLRRSWLVALALGCSSALFAADDWPQFRGPSGNAVASGESLPTEWNGEKNIAWKAKVPGFAWSQPIVWGDKIFVTTAITENQQKPRAGGGGFGGFGGPGGQGGGGRRGGFGPPGPDASRRDEAAKDDAANKQPAEKAGAGEKAKDDEPRRGGGRGQGGFGQGGPGRGGFGRGGAGGGRGGFGGGFGGGQPPDAVYQWKVLCIDANSGNILWEKLAHEGKPRIGIQPTNTYASETPITDGERIYAYFGMTGLFCFDVDGNLLWNKDVGAYPVGFGPASSPAFDGERVFLQCDNDEKSFLVAFDKKTGDEVWRVDRDERGNHSTPYVWKNKLRTELVTSGNTVRSYDPATGKLLWEYGTLGGSTKSTPVGDDEILVLGNSGGMGGGMRGRGGFGGGFGGGAQRGGRGDGGAAPGDAKEGERGPREGGAAPGQGPRGGAGGGRLTNSPLVAIKAGATGNVSLTGTETSNAGVAWAVAPGGPEMASPLLYEGNVYVLQRGNGLVGCYDAKTGKEHYRQRLEGARSFYASPVAADGKIYCLDEDGQTFVLAAGPELKLLATNKLDEMFRSSPAITGEKLLLRGVDHLYCIAQSAQ